MRSIIVLFTLALSLEPAFADSPCPTLNGLFQRETSSARFKFRTRTKQENGTFSYWVPGENLNTYFPADGLPKVVRDGDRLGTITHTCEGGTLKRVTKEHGSSSERILYITPLSDGNVRMESSEQGRSGIYTKVPE
jgi:hypothetical protein